MGRGKVELKRIEDKCSSQVTFSKRRKELIKKARELAVLCDVELSVFIFSGGGRFYEFSSGDSLSKILERYESHRRPGNAIQKMYKPKKLFRKMYKQKQSKQMYNMFRKPGNLDGERAEELNITELTQLEHQLNTILRQTRVKKEKLLREEKQLLEEEIAAEITEREEN